MSINQHSFSEKFFAWCVHLFTASGAVFGLFSAYQIYLHHYVYAFWLMVLTIVIDAVDGCFARWIKIKEVVPKVDGALLDNIVDFFNYTLLAGLFILVIPRLVPPGWHVVCAVAIVLSSCYQFTQVDAKTDDHFFKGFPSYWNIAVFYLFFWQMNDWVNVGIIFLFAVLSFIPIKYVYPSRLDYLADSVFWQRAMLCATLLWGIATIGLLWVYPKTNAVYVVFSMGYVILYIVASLYRTWRPLKRS